MTGFYITWFPFVIATAFPEMITGRTLHPVTDFITNWLAASNSFWNPIIYMLTLRPFKIALSKLWKNTLCGRYMCTGKVESVERPAAPPGRGRSDDNAVDGENTTQEQAVVVQCTRF